jgi:hypothetical protein
MVSPLRLFALLAPLVACGPALATPVAAAHERPAAVTQAATDVASDGATLNGIVTPGGHDTRYAFVYGTTRYEAHTAVADAGDGTAPVAVSAHIDGLTAATTYHFQLFAFSYHGGFAHGGDLTLTTAAAPIPAPPVPAPAPTAPTPSTTFSLTPASPPVLGQSVNVDVRSGTVKVKLPGTSTYVPVTDLSSIPVGSLLDTRDGSITMRSALPGGGTQAGIFHGGLFEVRQPANGNGVTELVLRGAPPACPRARASVAATKKKRKPPRRLWGHDDHGNFRTRGGNSVATVRGTAWFVEDRCDGTLTRVSKGAVSVYDSHRHVSVVVRAGHSYLARATH